MGAVDIERGRRGSRDLKNIKPFIRRDTSAHLPNDIWAADGHTLDAEIAHPLNGQPFRPEITTIIDVVTRRMMGWSVALTESRFAVLDALTHAITHNGVPAIFYVDNGRGYKNKMLADEVTGILPNIGITMSHALPYNSQAKGVIERSHQIWVAAAKSLPTFVGASMDEQARQLVFKVTRKALAAKQLSPHLMPWPMFIEWAGAVIAEYNARPHRSLGGISPNQAWQQFTVNGFKKIELSAIEQGALYRPTAIRKIVRGEIELFTNLYFSHNLKEFHGENLRVAYDIHDASLVWVLDDDGRVITTAEINGNRRHFMPVSVVEQARDNRIKHAIKRIDVKRDHLIDQQSGQLIEPTMIAIPHFPPAPDFAKADSETAIISPKIPAKVPRSSRPAAENYQDWLELDARVAAGEILTEDEARWHASYPNSAQFRASQNAAKQNATQGTNLRGAA